MAHLYSKALGPNIRYPNLMQFRQTIDMEGIDFGFRPLSLPLPVRISVPKGTPIFPYRSLKIFDGQANFTAHAISKILKDNDGSLESLSFLASFRSSLYFNHDVYLLMSCFLS